MKKNKMMRVASILLVAVLLTTSIISGTFAKYVTSGEAGDEARVAKFGVLVSAEGDLFDVTYKTTANTPGNVEDGEAPEYDEDDQTTLSVESFNGEKVVAPGTKNTDGLTFGVTGTPEVDVNIKIDFSAVKDIFLGANDELPDMTKAAYDDTFELEEDYYPLVFTLTGDYIEEKGDEIDAEVEDVREDDTVTGTLAQIEAVFDVLNNDGDGIFVDANTDLSDVENGGIGSFTLTWEWAFSDTESTAGENVDKADTLLGDLAAGVVIDFEDGEQDDIELPEDYDDYNLDVEVSLSITVTQID